MRPDSLLYRILWHTKRLLRIKQHTAPPPIVWRQDPTIKHDVSQAWIDALTEEHRLKFEDMRKEIDAISRVHNRMPTQPLTEREWVRLLKTTSPQERIQTLKFLRNSERKREKDAQRQAERKALVAEPKEERSPRIWISCHPQILHRWDQRQAALRAWRTSRLEETPHLAIDCRFLELHRAAGMNLTLSQIKYLISDNRDRREPWPILLANFDDTSPEVLEGRTRHLTTLDAWHNLATQASPRSYLDFFPRERLVYLSPHAEEEIEVVEPDKCYIIGGIVDRVHEPRIPLGASKITADADGIESRKLPLDRYVKWECGTKFLTLTAVVKILQHVYDAPGDWPGAFAANIPKRKVRKPEEQNPIGRDKRTKWHKFDKAVLHALYEENAIKPPPQEKPVARAN